MWWFQNRVFNTFLVILTWFLIGFFLTLNYTTRTVNIRLKDCPILIIGGIFGPLSAIVYIDGETIVFKKKDSLNENINFE